MILDHDASTKIDGAYGSHYYDSIAIVATNVVRPHHCCDYSYVSTAVRQRKACTASAMATGCSKIMAGSGDSYY